MSAALGVAVTLAAASSHAQSDASEAARALLVEQARAAGVRGDHAEAASLTERALAIHETPSLHLFLAEQRMALGRDVEALAQVERCRRASNPARPQEALVRRNCEVLRRTLVGRLAIVQVLVDPTDATVLAGDQPVPGTGEPTAVPAGTLTLRVTAPGYEPHEASLTLTRGETRDVAVRLTPVAPPPTVAPVAVEAPRAVAPAAPVVAPPRVVARPPPAAAPVWPAVAWVASGAALLAVVTPILVARRDALASRCTRTPDDDLRCPDASAFDDATTANDVVHPAAVSAAVVGGLSLLVGAVWWLRARSSHGPPRPAVTAWAGPRALSLSLAF